MIKQTLGAALLGTALFAFQPAMAQDYNADTVVATVNGTDITLGHMIALRMRLPEQYQTIPTDQLYQGILDQLVDQQVLSSGVGEDTRAIRLVIENERRAIRAGDAIDAYLSEPVDEEELQKAYDAQYGNVEPTPEFNASHILVETEDEAKELVTALEGGADFAELAKEKSTGPSGPNGGSLGWFGLGQMVPPFEAAVVAMEAGDVSAPVQTQFGWHVVKLNETRETPVPTLEDTRAELTQAIKEQGLRAELDLRRTQADVTMADVEIPFDALVEDELLAE